MVLAGLAKSTINGFLNRRATELRPRSRQGLLVDIHQMLAHEGSIYTSFMRIYKVLWGRSAAEATAAERIKSGEADHKEDGAKALEHLGVVIPLPGFEPGFPD